VLETNGVELALRDIGDGPPVILSHGFPELAYSWRHQIPALATHGYRAIAPDQRGYGRSSLPAAVEAYDILSLTGDLLAILDDIGEERGFFVGHDWGAMVVWQLALLAPERVAGVVTMSVPFVPRASMAPIAMLRQLFADKFFYIVYFQTPGVADEELGRDPARTMRRLLAGLAWSSSGAPDVAAAMADDGRGFIDRLREPAALPPWLTTQDLEHYIAEFSRTGFTGGINWYRNMDRNWALTPQLDGARVEVPSLFIGGRVDPVLAITPVSIMDGWLSDHHGNVLIDDAGHWIQQEKAGEVNHALLGFLDSLQPDRS
jgi:pimeloyl-ACP methyl ester carboxylesterase